MIDMLLLLIVLALCVFFMNRMHSGPGRSSGHVHANVDSEDQNKMGMHPLWMLVVCVLPLFVFFMLMSNGYVINSGFFILFFLLGCVAMFFFMDRGMGCDVAEDKEEALPSTQQVSDIEMRVEGVFRIRSYRTKDDAIVLEGTPVGDTERVFDLLVERFEETNLTPLFQENDAGEPVVVLLPDKAEMQQTKRRSAKINLGLFILTLITTTWAGAAHQGVDLWRNLDQWMVGLPYALGLMAILGLHELGHYVAARMHRMSVTLPYFIPVPFALGTFGAFIQMRSTPKNRSALFDVGVTGPLAGLVIAIPALLIGLQYSTPILTTPSVDLGMMGGGVNIGSSLLLSFLAKLALGDTMLEGHQLILHPLAFAGWLGLLLTALNLLPIGQLDGGHIAHALFGRRRSDTIGTVALFGMFILGVFVWQGLLTWAIIVYFIAGTKSAPPLDDVTTLDNRRVAIGAFAFVMLFLILTPVPHALYPILGFECPYI